MTKLEILDILGNVFVGIPIQVEPRSKFSIIYLRGTGLKFHTYKEDSSNSDCIWYCNVWIVNESKEIRIPNEMCREFIEEIYEHTKVLNKINVKVASIKKRFTEMNSQEAIRDMKLKTILDDKNS